MLQVVVVVLEGALRVVRRVDEDALHPAPVKRQQGLEGLQVVALDQQVLLRLHGIAMGGYGVQQPVGHLGGGGEGGRAVEPVKRGHGAVQSGGAG